MSVNEVQQQELLRIANKFYRQNKLRKAAVKYKEVLSSNSQNIEALVNLANILTASGNDEVALKFYKRALSIKPDYAIVYNNLGNLYKKRGDKSEARVNYKRAIELDRKYSSAHNNLALLEYQEKNYKLARAYISQALVDGQKIPEVINTYGAILEAQGKIGASLSLYQKAMKLDQAFTSAMGNHQKLKLQLFSERNDNKFKRVIDALLMGGPLEPRFYVHHALYSFLRGDWAACKKTLERFESVSAGNGVLIDPYTAAYRHLVQRQLVYRKFDDSEASREVYHVGDSHCLSFAGVNFQMNRISYKIIPLLTIGAKAYHFSKDSSSAYKSITLRNLAAITPGSMILVSFGEIDCRTDEGYIKAARKFDVSINKLIDSTVSNFVSWFEQAARRFKHRVAFFNVPAPVYKTKLGKIKNQQVLEVIRQHNTVLERALANKKISLLDVFRVTSENNEYSNKLYHIDSQHLTPETIKHIDFENRF